MPATIPRGPRVLDWDDQELGTLREVRRAQGTSKAAALVVELGPAARRRLPHVGTVLMVPMRYVFGFRSDEVHLDRSLAALAHALAQAEAPQR